MSRPPLEIIIGDVLFETFPDESRRWRWRATRKGRKTAKSGESFASRGNAERAMKAFLNSLGLKGDG